MIDANKILQVDALDLIFEGRNKEYGAYELRRNYRKRLLVAMLTMILMCAGFILLNAFAGGPGKKAELPVTTIIDLEPPPVNEKLPEPPAEPPPPKAQIQSIKHVTPVIVNTEVKPEEMPPLNEDIENSKIGPITQKGVVDDGIVAPPLNEGNGVTELPKKQEAPGDEIVLTVQIESSFPGGMSAWIRYLTKSLPKYYTEDFVERGLQGRVLVQFIVDKEGNVSDVRGIEGPKELWAIAENVIRKSGKWEPAIQNGYKVKSYKRQPIIFQIEEE